MFTKFILTGIIGLLFYPGFASPAIYDTIKPLYDTSDFIFIGKVKGMNDYGSSNISAGKPVPYTLVDIDVVEIYKGRRWSKVMILAEKNKYVFELNKEYLFYSKHDWVINRKGKKQKSGYLHCLRSRPVENDIAFGDVKELYKIIKTKLFGRIKSPRAKIILRKCNCMEEKI
ncbi:MAG: hypothetical protein HY840_13510 [Bacteroidetes bacterium]|nr:hypothetical protein [Bacteroidota bacterium]